MASVGANRYQYAHGDPINASDPSGHATTAPGGKEIGDTPGGGNHVGLRGGGGPDITGSNRTRVSDLAQTVVSGIINDPGALATLGVDNPVVKAMVNDLINAKASGKPISTAEQAFLNRYNSEVARLSVTPFYASSEPIDNQMREIVASPAGTKALRQVHAQLATHDPVGSEVGITIDEDDGGYLAGETQEGPGPDPNNPNAAPAKMRIETTDNTALTIHLHPLPSPTSGATLNGQTGTPYPSTEDVVTARRLGIGGVVTGPGGTYYYR